MKITPINALKAYELTKNEQFNIRANGTKLGGGEDTDGEENCLD